MNRLVMTTAIMAGILTGSVAAWGGDAPKVTAPAEEQPWLEPGQVKDSEYLKHGALRYSAEDREIVGRNRTCFNNRPLYCQPDNSGFVLVGDRPLVRLIAETVEAGVWSAALVRDNTGIWFHDCAEVESRYRCGRMTWRIADPSWPGVRVDIEVYPMSWAGGFVLRLKASGVRTGDKLVWTLGGIRSADGTGQSLRWKWDPVMHGNPDVFRTGNPRNPLTRVGFLPADCANNHVWFDGGSFRIQNSADARMATMGAVDHAGILRVADASACADPVQLAESSPDKLPTLCGVMELLAGKDEATWAVQFAEAETPTHANVIQSPARALAEAAAYLQSIERIRTDTPEPRLDAAVAAVAHAMDGACDRDPTVFRHGCMSFHIPFLGWRVICGSTALGWHDRVKGNAAHYFASQVQEDKLRTQPVADDAALGTREADDSRMRGRGWISKAPTPYYNTQTQFFDQTCRDWRWTADPELERMLRPALELQLEWAKDCFDPDDDGLYESYVNTLPTDSVWYNGGGSAEESAYAYYAHLAARDMARRAQDTAAAERHQARADAIQRAMRQKLWLKDRGHFGLYVEQGGHHRVHPDAWYYSQFLPIDAGLCTPEQAIQALYYTEWGLERIQLPFGGVLCMQSNWVPSVWSVREAFNGDLWHLALAYAQTSLADEGWELLLGAMLESCYAGVMPGGFSHIGAGADFADSKDMFARAVVEGLFGYDPDYPNGVVRIRPAFPSAWPRAAIRTPDYSFSFQQQDDIDIYQLELARAAVIKFHLPVRAGMVRRVMLDGQVAQWSVKAGFGCTHLIVETNKPVTTASVAIELADRVPQAAAVTLEARVGDTVRLASPRGKAEAWQDFHEILEDARAEDRTVTGRLARKPGCHLVLVDMKVGDLPQRQVFRIRVSDPQAEAELAARTPREAPPNAQWKCLDLAPVLNGDVRAIFKQKYLTPRPNTCSVRIGTDGWSAWTFVPWGWSNRLLPQIDLDNVPTLSGPDGRLQTAQNVPFAMLASDKNIAFTSLWDNWPRSVTLPVGQSAEAIWLLVCGSTNPMQLRQPNAVVRFHYGDGEWEQLELIPPLNFWPLGSWGGKDYSYETDAFALPFQPPPMVQLGKECRAMVLSWKLRPGKALKTIELETLSQEVVIGLMGVSLMNPGM